MERILIYGSDSVTDSVLHQVYGTLDEFISAGGVGFVTASGSENLFWNMPVRKIADISENDFDKLVIIYDGDGPITRKYLHSIFKISLAKMVFADYLIHSYIIYKNQDSNDPEVSQTINQMKQLSGFDVWCGYNNQSPEINKVWWDPTVSMPYIWYEGHKVYYPRDHKFQIYKDELVVEGFMFEQQANSPHLYTTCDHQVDFGDVVVDVGVCEGNFAIKYIDKCSKMYLVESDPKWIYPLRFTFKDYPEKVTIVPKALGSEDTNSTITLDTLLVDQQCDFLKMDIEGAEEEALRAGINALRNNVSKCSICCYHKHNDEIVLREILNQCGFETSLSKGLMIFSSDSELFKWHELRHCIIYGRKHENGDSY